MIGNDIVDLRNAGFSSRVRKTRYAKKILSITEQQYFNKNHCNETLLWRFWSVKEAVYKANCQECSDAVFSPANIEVKIISQTKAIAHFNGIQFSCETQSCEQSVYSTAFSLEEKIISQQKEISCNNTGYIEVRSQLLETASRYLGLPTNQLRIEKRDGKIPRLYHMLTLNSWAISFTHHKRFCGYAIAL